MSEYLCNGQYSVTQPIDFDFRALNLAVFRNDVVLDIAGELHVQQDAVLDDEHVEIVRGEPVGAGLIVRFTAGRKRERHVVPARITDVAER